MIKAHEAILIDSIMNAIEDSIMRAVMDKKTHTDISFSILCFDKSTVLKMMKMLTNLGYEIKDFKIDNNNFVFFNLYWSSYPSVHLNLEKAETAKETVLKETEQILKEYAKNPIRYFLQNYNPNWESIKEIEKAILNGSEEEIRKERIELGRDVSSSLFIK